MPKSTFYNLEKDKQERIYEASLNEFARTRYEDCKVSNIIKEAGIPRGSFYQYFEDKFDLYSYVFDEIAKKKMEYLGDIQQRMHEINFFDMWEEMYAKGAKFGMENPRLIAITQFLLSSRDHIYDRLMAKNMKLALDYYVQMIDINKEKGLIRQDIDSETLANIVIETTMNVAFEHMVHTDSVDIDYDMMKDIIKKRINIFRKGVETGD